MRNRSKKHPGENAKLKAKLKLKVVRSFDPQAVDHRADFMHCPSCGTKHEPEIWDANAAKLILEIVHGKHGSLTIVSECPKCFEPSWVHTPFSAFGEWGEEWVPDNWKKAAAEEHTRRHVRSVHRFADSLCAKCVHLRSLVCDTLPVVHCTLGEPPPTDGKVYLHSCFTETECPAFQAREPSPEKDTE